MPINGYFSWIFDQFFTFFIDCGHIHVPKGAFWGSTSSPHIGDVMMSLFFTLGSTVHDWGWPKNGPFWTKNGQTWQACQRSKVVQRGPKGTKMVNLSLFDHLGPRLGPSGPFWTISNKNDFFAQKHLRQTLFCPYGAFYGDIILCHRYRQQKVPNTF